MKKHYSKFLFIACTYLFVQCSSIEWTTDLSSSEDFKDNAHIYNMSIIGGLSINQNISFGPYSTGIFDLADLEQFSLTLKKDNGESCSVTNTARREDMVKTVTMSGENRTVSTGKVLVMDLVITYKNQRGIGEYQSNSRTLFEHNLLNMNIVPYSTRSRKKATRFDGILFRSDDNKRLIGAIDLRDKILWIDKNLTEDQQHILATVATALSYNPPR